MSPPSGASLPSPIPSHPSRLSQSPGLSSVSCATNSHWLSVLHMVMYVSLLLSQFIPASPWFPLNWIHWLFLLLLPISWPFGPGPLWLLLFPWFTYSLGELIHCVFITHPHVGESRFVPRPISSWNSGLLNLSDHSVLALEHPVGISHPRHAEPTSSSPFQGREGLSFPFWGLRLKIRSWCRFWPYRSLPSTWASHWLSFHLSPDSPPVSDPHHLSPARPSQPDRSSFPLAARSPDQLLEIYPMRRHLYSHPLIETFHPSVKAGVLTVSLRAGPCGSLSPLWPVLLRPCRPAACPPFWAFVPLSSVSSVLSFPRICSLPLLQVVA